jgi:hypothetical protein
MDDTPYRRNPVLQTEHRSHSPSDEERHKMRFASILSPCLSLVAPISMTDADRKSWLQAAYIALKHVPFDLLEQGAKVALSTCSSTSKIVPTILDEISVPLRWRTEHQNDKPLRLAAPSKVKDEPLSRELLDRLEGNCSPLLAAVRDCGLAKGYIYRAEDGKLYHGFEPREKAA